MGRIAGILLVLAAMTFVACGDDEDEPATTTDAVAEQEGAGPTGTEGARDETKGAKPDEPTEPGLEVATAESQFGEVLFDADDRAIYYFDKEKSSESECYGACAEAWPPVLTEGDPQAGGAAEASLLGTTRRDDGTTQVTYDGRPLYFYVDDPPGELLCHNVEEFGGLWLAVQPDGAPVA